MLVYETEQSYYVFFLKSGHNLLKSVVDSLFAKYSIGFSSNYNILLTSEEFRRKQKFLFVRNPINRFFSSYYYFDFYKTMGIDAYIEYFKTTSRRDHNAHLDSQYKCLSVGKDIKQVGMKDYFDSKLGEYKIIKIEDLDSKIEGFKRRELISNNLYDEEIAFDFLDTKNKAINIDFILLYLFFKNYNEMGHHKKVNFLSKINQHQYFWTYSLFEEEMLFYGYEHLDNTKFIKSII